MSKPIIDFNTPDEKLVMQLIYRDASSVEARGWFDAFTVEEVMQMWHSEHVHNNWSEENKDWLDITAGELLDIELNISR